MIRNREEIVKYKRCALLEVLKNEEIEHGGYEKWYSDLSSFRDLITKRFKYSKMLAPNLIRTTEISNGVVEDIFDHHLLGYLAPLNFKRLGFNGVLRTPAEQIGMVSNMFKQRGVRFIYLSLPCEIAVYPEKIASSEMIPSDRKMIPQWRKMIKECIEDFDVEVLDAYDKFLEVRNKDSLYIKGHSISPFGAKVIGEMLSAYLKETISFGKEDLTNLLTSRDENIITEVNSSTSRYSETYNIYSNSRKVCIEKNGVFQPYIGINMDSEIGIFGNCNLQSFIADGAGIIANTSFELSYPLSYLGRRLPFSSEKGDTFDSFKENSLKNIKTIIYVGFPSGSYVRSPNVGNLHRFHPIYALHSLVRTMKLPPKTEWSTKGLRDNHY